ncbi:iron-sulfur-binding reductase [Knoellia sinensis KCTC 19936]|uniref:Iron-sulfur-binding reductase n=1 Tax=Knoellia sinensis KCTC 19936 TaxID=1385520 RepID=A0A0A0J7P5_9MICO|nr:heterodisulfide reductase-related iron-sulfur binding cluster [Knoellia sinensis]KGN31626.1 iron-sulfur-binding reductase [Knoellia sinensis KCTC 19936]
MSALQIVAAAICFPLMLVGFALLFRQIGRFVALYKMGQADPRRTNDPGARTWTLLKEFLGHTRMSRLPIVAIAHWFTALSFLLLIGTLVNAFGQLIEPSWIVPIIGHFPPYEWMVEFFAWTGLIGIVVLIAIRQLKHPRSAAGTQGRRSRFFGSTWWQAYYVEFTIFGVTTCILLLRTLEAALTKIAHPEENLALHFPLTNWLSGIWSGLSLDGIEQAIVVVAFIKILISFAWMITISLTPTMGVAWHRFLAFPNIWFKRESSGGTALGNLKPMTMGDGTPFSMEAMEALEEVEDAPEPVLGVGKVEDFTWKGLLDFSTCTECGRCQSQCPAWNTEKPLSPKLLMMTLRDHVDAKSPWIQASEEARASMPSALTQFADMPLIGGTGYDIDSPFTAYNPHGPEAVIDEDVLWSCTTCGACVEQCPVDIEHVDHIVDMRRYQTLIESAFPSELGGLFKNLESKGNPWGMGARARLDWAKDLPFEVKILGKDLESAEEVDYLFWVGCAGAYEDRAKKTTRAVAELLDTAGVSFAVLGDGETCTGDSARRAGNEILFSMLAQQNIETMGELGVQKIVVTCAHCFNTIKNEYPDLGGKFEVVHHTQLLNRLVRDKKLVPVARPADAPGMSSAKNAASTAATVTYHDPCYLGRHNNVYAPPRELIGALPGVELREMERSKEKSFCCGAGGARMWMEEKLGSRINMNRTEEALATGAERIAIGCPFCRVMISDGLTAKQSEGVGEDVEVVDVAQMLLAAVRRGQDSEVVEAGSVDEPAAAAVAAESASYAGQSGSALTAGAAVAGATAGAAGAGTASEASTGSAQESAFAPAGEAKAPAPAAAEADPWDEPAAAAPAAAAPAAAEADPWDEPAAAPAAPAAPAAAEADPWDEPAAAAPAAAEADPWDEPAAAPAAPAAPAAAEADPWDEPAAAAPAAAEADPWDEPAAAPAAPAAPAAAEADPWDEPAAAAPAAAEADPWDEPAAAPAAPAAPAAAEADPWDEPAAAAPAATEADPWDEPAAAAPAAKTEAPAAPAEADPWDEPADAAPAAAEPAAAAPAASDDVDPWDEPANAAPAVSEAKTTNVETEAPAAPAASDDVDPWDEPATVTEKAAASEGAPSPEKLEDAAAASTDDVATSAETATPSATAVQDDLFSAPDPWDDASAPTEPATATTDGTPEAATDEASTEVSDTAPAEVPEPVEAIETEAAAEVEADVDAESTSVADAEADAHDEAKTKAKAEEPAAPVANADDLLNAPDPWD